MAKQITVQIKTVYGNEVIYPACADAVIFARIAGTKTLTVQALRDIRALGYEIVVEHPAVHFAA